MLKMVPFYASLLGYPLTDKIKATNSHVLVYGAIEAHSFGEKGCIASNKTLATETGLSESTVANALSTMASKANWIRVDLDENNHRTLITPLMIIEPPFLGEVTPLPPPMNIGNSNKVTIRNRTIPKGIGGKPQKLKSVKSLPVALSESDKLTQTAYGKPEINELFTYWQEIVGYPITSSKVKNRYAANTLLKQHGLGGVQNLVRGVAAAQADQFGPRIADFCDLQFKLNKLILWAKQRGGDNGRAATI